MRNMNKSLVCILFVLLGVAGCFADDREESIRYRRSNTFSKANFADSYFAPRIFRREVSSKPSQTDNPDNASSTPSNIENAINEVESTVGPLRSSDSSTTVLEDITATPVSTPDSTESSSSTTISDSDLPSKLNTQSLPNINFNTPSKTPASDAITNPFSDPPSTATTLAASSNIPSILDSRLGTDNAIKPNPPRAIGSFSQSSSGPNPSAGLPPNGGPIPNGGSFPNRGSFPNLGPYPNGGYPNNFAVNPGYGYPPPAFGNFGPQPGPNVPSAPGFSSQGFTFPGGSGFTSTFTSGSGNAGGFASAGSYAGAGVSTGFDAPNTFLNRGAFMDDGASDFGNPSGPGANPFAQGLYNPNNQGMYPNQNGPNDFQQRFDQYFRNLQAQQEAFQQQIQQQQLQQQIQQQQLQQQAGHYSWASSMSYITNPPGVSDPNARVYAYSETSPDGAIASSHVDSKLGYGVSKSTVSGNSILEMNNRIGSGSQFGEPSYGGSFGGQSYGGPFYGGSPGGGAGGSYGGNSGPQSASAIASIGPQGGFQAGQISPAAPGIFSRFGESVPPPSGNSYGVFSSSSSHHSVGSDGKETAYKSATTGINDNGKVIFRTVHD